MKQIVLMFSGGLDSTVAYFYAKALGASILPIYVNLGHPYAGKEQRALKELIQFGITARVIDCLLYQQVKHRITNHIFPSRNVLLATIGSMFGDRVWVCSLDGEDRSAVGDKSELFFKGMQEVLSCTNKFFQAQTVVESPFSCMSKTEIVRLGLVLECKRAMEASSSCFHPTIRRCGQCVTCYKRWAAFLMNGIDEPCTVNPWGEKYAEEMKSAIPAAARKADHSRFSPKRIAEHVTLCKMVE